MVWRCPACQTILNLSHATQPLHTGDRYRCHVCHVTMNCSTISGALVITSLDADGAHAVDPHAARVRPVPPGKLDRTSS